MAQNSDSASAAGNMPKLIAAWTLVAIPFAWGVYVTAGNALKLFK